MPDFASYRATGDNWITMASGEYYPDILIDACNLYQPVLTTFGQLLRRSESSVAFYRSIMAVPQPWMRTQLTRIFRKYVSPTTPVEMLKRKVDADRICQQWGGSFRPIPEVQQAFLSRPANDEALCAVLWEYKDRGQKGYDLTERFFDLVRSMFPTLHISGPERAGQDILLGTVFDDYPRPRRPVDFIIRDAAHQVLAVGLARYDSDRGGAQEDDRIGGYRECARELETYAAAHNLPTKIIFLNDGPGLLLGSMWRDYGELEQSIDRVLVLTLRMLPARLSLEWLQTGGEAS